MISFCALELVHTVMGYHTWTIRVCRKGGELILLSRPQCTCMTKEYWMDCIVIMVLGAIYNFSWSQASNSQECIYSNIIVVMAPKVHHGPNQPWNCRRGWCLYYPHQIKVHAGAWESNLLMSWLGVQDHNHYTILPPPLYHPAHSYAHTQTYNMYTPQYSWWASNTSDLCSHMWIALNGKHKIKHNGSSMQNTI